MKKTVYLNGRFLTRPLSGVQRTAYELVMALDDLLDQAEFANKSISFVLLYSGKIENPIVLNNIKLVKKGCLSGNLWEQLELPIYTIGNLLVSMCSISTIFKTKQVVIVHDASFWVNKQFFSLPFRLWYKFAIPLLGKISRQIISVSNFSKKELVKYGGLNPDKITVIYNAADHILRFGEPSDTFKEAILKLKPFCLSVSSLGANKNYKGLSIALEQVKFSNYNMLIAGGEMRTLKFSAPESAVTYLGYVSNDELKYLYQHASLFIFPSFYEGFGIPPLEAMISFCPVIASNTSSIPEVLQDACAYFDPGSPADMADKINKLIHDPVEMNRYMQKGYLRANSFSWDKSAREFYRLIRMYC